MCQHLHFQHSFWDVIQEVTYHCIWTIIWVGVILCDKRILLERGLSYTLKSPNKQLMHRFLHFIVHLQSRFYTLALIFVLDVNIYSSSLRLFKIHPVVTRKSSTCNQLAIFNFSVVFAVTLVSQYFCFKYLHRVRLVIFQASDIAKRLGINFLVILQRYCIARTEDFRRRYLYLLKVVDKIYCLRATRIRLHNSK
jgi:hypothetical protein